MRSPLVSFAGLATLLLAGVTPQEAHATGGVFFTEEDAATTVREHRVVLSVSDDQTSLWDDLAYTGEPADLAWVLPVQGPAEIAESSVYLQRHLDAMTEVTVSALFCCPDPTHCTDPVTGEEVHGAPITERAVAEPFETLRIASADAGALAAWLAAGGYVVTEDVAAVLDDYAARGFDFLAVRFAPDADVSDTRPLRVTMPGRHTALPIPMLRAGAAEVIDTTLWIVSDTDYLPPSWFQVEGNVLVWDWDTRTSNYEEVVAARRAEAGDGAWLLEAVARPYSTDMDAIALETAGYRGTADERAAAAEADLQALIGPIVEADAWIHVTRLSAQLTAGAAVADLELAETPFEPFEQPWADAFVGDNPCPPRPPSSGAGVPPGDGGEGGGGSPPGGAGGGGAGPDGGSAAAPADDGGCSLGAPPGERSVAASMLVLLVTVLARGITRRPSRGAASRGRSPAAGRCGRTPSAAPPRAGHRGSPPRSR